MGRKFGGSPLLGRGSGIPITKSPGPKHSSIPNNILIHAAIWPQHIWAENWGLYPFGGGGAGFPPNTMWPGPRPTCMPSFILIRPTVWTQCTNVADRQDRQRTDSIGRTVLQTVDQKFTMSIRQPQKSKYPLFKMPIFLCKARFPFATLMS